MNEKLLEVTDGDILFDEDSPQGQARVWLLDTDPANVDPCTYSTLHQRYALATFYYATRGDEWIDNTEWLKGFHECDWTKVTCDESFMLTELVIGKLGSF